ncbi:hypothetical protein BK138_35155 [Paenibacillus rhizosphaerae]|uniref:Spore germination GerAC-like C-terminal domain-containing protein n=1 Tax=Paenibacillus rhizosphaerae TaxID=297318 RepID=A0A1R1DWS7_9BACL|nr:hypothetical protein BK138_35155 [Paenibacillus rhizosphaerae]
MRDYREAGIRLPQQIGPLVSIVRALVIGQAAVLLSSCRQHPRIWKTLKPHWHETFPELPITVAVHLRYRDPGQTNSSL